MLSVKQDDLKYHFLVFGMTRPGIEPRSPGPLANTLLIRPMARFTLLYPNNVDFTLMEKYFKKRI